MARDRSLLFKELSKKDSDESVKMLLKKRIKLQARYHMIPGMLLFTSYNAKDQSQTFDKTPLILILKRNSKYTLGLNFHWIPLSMRLNLVKAIIKMNTKNIEKNKPLEFSYEKLKPMLKSLGYAPCIRLYINSRLGNVGVPVPPENLLQMARLKTESFTNGKYSASQLYQMAKAAGKRRFRK